MLHRLSGLVLIVNTLLPLLAAAGGFSVFAAARGPTRDLIAAVDSIRSEVVLLDSTLIDAAIDTIAARVDAVKQRLATAGEVVTALRSSVAAGFRHLNLNVDFPQMPQIQTFVGPIQFPQLPDIDLRIGDELAKPFRAIGSSVGYLLDVAGDFQGMLGAVRGIVESEQIRHLKTHVREARDAQKELATLVGRVVTAVKILLILALPWIALSYGLWSHARLTRGWALLRGGTA